MKPSPGSGPSDTPVFETGSTPEIERIRAFNRFYTQRIGVLKPIGTDLTLSAARLVAEIPRLGAPTAGDLARTLSLDPGYVSRQISKLVDEGLVEKERSAEDGRRQILGLTEAGLALHARLTREANAEMAMLLEPLDVDGRRRLVSALDTVEHLIGNLEHRPFRIREHGPGDLGWVLERHGELYSQEEGFDPTFEALVSTLISGFAVDHDPRRERLWIADDEGQRLGSIMLVSEGEPPTDIARLRLFLVEPHARGRGVGTGLVETLLDFARRRGYRRIVLTTVDALDAARRIYERYGFYVERSHEHSHWSVPVVEQDWALDL